MVLTRLKLRLKSLPSKLKNKISVIGLGYVGLPLAISAAQSGYEVVGVDNDPNKIKLLKLGQSTVEDVSDTELQRALHGNLQVGTEFSKTIDSSIVIICVPTPLTNDRKPNLEFIEGAVKDFAKFLKKSTLVILESTVQPGTTRNFLASLIEKNSSLSGDEFDVAYSPERIDPLNKNWTLINTPKIVSGLSNIATTRAKEFYSKFVHNIVECDTPEVAELAKLLENSFRYVNISFINEFSIFCHEFGVDVNQVIQAASTKPYGFMPFYPSLGVGGHCIPVDPLYLSERAREIGVPLKFIELADDINQSMPSYFISRAENQLESLNDKKVLVVGVSYKSNVADVRESPVEVLISGLKQKGARVYWHDDLVKLWNGEKSVALSSDFDLAIIATPHDYLDLTKLGNVPIINTRGSI